MEITISFTDEKLYNKEYEDIVNKVVSEVAKVYGLDNEEELGILLCNNAYIHRLNKEYRQVDAPTDVLSFSLNEGEVVEAGVASRLLGDIIISLERAKEQAEEFGHSMERELAYLTVHGCLHILGYDHMEEEEKKEMRKEEEYILGRLQYLREDEPYCE